MLRAPRPFDAVIFDLDGTLVDSAPDIARALNATFAEAGYPQLPLENVIAGVGDGARLLIERSLPPHAAGVDVTPLLARFVDHYGRNVAAETRLYPGVAPLLERLRAQNVAIAVLTNKPGPLARKLLDELALTAQFQRVIGDGDGFPRKPDPMAARAIIADLGCTPERTVIVGDGVADVRTARAVPCAALAVTWGYVARDRLAAEGPQLVARTPDEMAAVLLPPSSP